MDAFCGSEFWDPNLTWNTTNPHFTPCFESTILRLLPFYFVIIFGVIDVLNASRSKFRRKSFWASFNCLITLKSLLTLALIVIQLSEIVRLKLELDHNEPKYTMDYLAPFLQSVGYVMVLVLSLMKQYRMVSSSGVQFFFWLTTTVTQALIFQTAFRHFINVEEGQGVKNQIVYMTRLISFPIIVLRLGLEFLDENIFESKNDPKLGKPNPARTSNFVSKLLFLWYDNLAWRGYKRTLTKEDLWDLKPEDTSRVQIDRFSKFWKKDEAKAAKRTKETGKEVSAGILVPLLKCYGVTYAFGMSLRLISDMLMFVQPLMLRLLVAHVTTPDGEPAWKGFLYMGVICTAALFQSLLNASSNKRAQQSGMHVRTAVSNAVFRKSLVISNSAKKESSAGEIVNLQSVDTNKMLEFLLIFNMNAAAPFQIIFSIVFLYQTLGPSVFAGVGILAALVPLNMYFLSASRKYQVEQMKLKDERLKLTSEVMNGIKVLKLYGWEPAYQEQIEAIRQKEMACLKKIAMFNVFTGFIFITSPVFVSLCSFVTYVLVDPANVLNAEKTFVAMSLFNIMRMPMITLPMTLSIGMQAAVSVKRLNKFLNLEELDRNAVSHSEIYKDPIVIENGTFSWTPQATTLKNINFSVKSGELVAVVGTIGAGKTSLLSSLLGDLTKHSGIVNTKGDVAYVSQSAWIQNATVRDNILFGDGFVSGKYKRTINACALETDLQMLSEGDQTEIGEKGINLSGGQKQRISLARAAYKDASIYLFDDPLSAVDSHVGKHIFENLIGPTGILTGKTRVLVTHAVSFLPRVDRIVVMKNGQISETGTYKELLIRQGEFAEFLMTHLGVESDDEVDPDRQSVIQDLEDVIGAEAVRRRSSTNRESVSNKKMLYKRLSSKMKIEEKSKQEETPPPKKLIEEEISAEGNIPIRIYLDYFKSAGILMAILAIGVNALSNALIALSNIWLSSWSTQATLDEELTGTTLRSTTDKYLLGYGLIGAAIGVTTLISTGTLALVGLAASRTLHSAAISRVLRAPMSYFDTTLMGRLINRFSRDMDTLDNIIPMNMRTFFYMFYNVIFTFIVISYTTPIFIAFIIPVAIFYFFLQRFYVATSRQLKRLEGVTRSPIYSHFGETISGSSIIRAFRLEDTFILESENRVDMNQKSYFPFLYSSIWISIRLEFIGILIILFTCLLVLLSRDSIDPGDAGLAISYSLQITGFLNVLARIMSDIEANIVSVERVGELKETPQEPEWEKPDSKPALTWPENGKIVFDNYMTRYREGLELVLKGVSCTIHPGEKIGVVGRTGAGKSSLTLALFRIIESAGGKILIDGIDISTLGLHDLRKKITIIPQDPVLFSGTLRENLDPFNQYSDEQVWRCLELAHLKSLVTTFREGLQYKVAEEGQNFSVGQRQLICLARALLRKTRILVLDEATAAVDLETDDLIQATIRKEFSDSTIVTIAHRLNTIMDSHRVLVLDKGEIREFDPPSILLQNPKSIFFGMAHDAKLV